MREERAMNSSLKSIFVCELEQLRNIWRKETIMKLSMKSLFLFFECNFVMNYVKRKS